MPFTRQTNFSGGELSPKIHGRTDLPVWQAGAKRLRNFFVSRQGQAVSRPGTGYCFTSDIHTKRLIPFVRSDIESYVLVLGDETMRFMESGALMLDMGSPLEIATPWTSAEVSALRYAQVGDIMTLTHPDHEPYELSYDGSTWTLSPVDFELLPTHSVDIADQADPLPTFKLRDDPDNYIIDSTAAPLREWKYYVTALVKHAQSMRTFETRALHVSQYRDVNSNTDHDIPAELALAADHPLTIERLGSNTATVYGSDYLIIQYNLYRGRESLLGFVGSTKTSKFVDVADEPDYRIQPPRGKDPFHFLESFSGSTALDDYPGCVGFFEERRVFAGTPLRPNSLLFSATGNFWDFDDESLLPIATQALTYELASRRRERIRDVLQFRRLLVFTTAGVWSIGGSGGEPLSPETLPLARVEDEVGAGGPTPLLVDGTALYPRVKGRGVRALLADDTGGFTPRDVSWHAGHLFVSSPQYGLNARDIIDWCFAEDPWGLVWAVTEDGALLSLTPMRDAGAYAWAEHDCETSHDVDFSTDQRSLTVHAICSVPESDEDAVYMAVSRFINGSRVYFVERMRSRLTDGGEDDAASLDCAVIFDDLATTTLTNVAPHLAGEDVYVSGVLLSTGEPFSAGPFTVSGLGTVELDQEYVTRQDGGDDYSRLYIGLRYTCDIELLPVVGTTARGKQKTTVAVGFEVPEDESVSGLQLGQDLDNLTSAPSPEQGVVMVPVMGTWDKAAGGALRQNSPLPVTITGVLREVDVGD